MILFKNCQFGYHCFLQTHLNNYYLNLFVYLKKKVVCRINIICAFILNPNN